MRVFPEGLTEERRHTLVEDTTISQAGVWDRMKWAKPAEHQLPSFLIPDGARYETSCLTLLLCQTVDLKKPPSFKLLLRYLLTTITKKQMFWFSGGYCSCLPKE